MIRSVKPRHSILLFLCIVCLATFAQISAASPDDDTDRCQTLQDCIDKYQTLVPQWERSIREFSTQLKEELPKIEEEFKAFGKQGEKQLQQWLDEMEKTFPETIPEKPKPETTWI